MNSSFHYSQMDFRDYWDLACQVALVLRPISKFRQYHLGQTYYPTNHNRASKDNNYEQAIRKLRKVKTLPIPNLVHPDKQWCQQPDLPEVEDRLLRQKMPFH